MADEKLTTEIDVTDSPLEAALGRIVAGLHNFDKGVSTTNSNMSAFELGQKRAAEALQATAGHGKHTGDVFEQLGQHSRTLAMGFETLGFAGAEGFARVEGGVEALKASLMGVNPLMLGIAGAAAGLFMIFEQVSESIKAMSESQAALAQLGNLIRNQGGDWRAITKDIDEYATKLAQTTQFSKTDFVSGIQAMLVAGMSLATAEKSQQAAMDLSVAKGITLKEADEALAMAHNHRMRSLQALGLVTTAEVKNGISYDAILERIEKRMNGSAAAALQTYSGQMALLHNNVEIAREKFGEALLPILELVNTRIIGMAQSMVPLLEHFAKWTTSIAPQFGGTLDSIGKLFAALGPVIELVGQNIGQLFTTLGYIGHEIRELLLPALQHLFESFGLAGGASDLLEQSVSASQAAWIDLRKVIADAVGVLADFTNWIADHHEVVEAFFSITLAVVAVNALAAAKAGFYELLAAIVASDLWAGLTLVVEAFALGLEGGLLNAIRAAIVGLWDLVGAEAAASLGITLLIAGIIELGLHWNDIVPAMKSAWTDFSADLLDTLGSIVDWLGKLEDAIKSVADMFAGSIPGMKEYGDTLGWIADKAHAAADWLRNLAQAKRDDAAASAAPGKGHPVQDVLTGRWIDSVTMEPVAPPKGQKNPGDGEFDKTNTGGGSWGSDFHLPTGPTGDFIPGSAGAKKAKTAKTPAPSLGTYTYFGQDDGKEHDGIKDSQDATASRIERNNASLDKYREHLAQATTLVAQLRAQQDLQAATTDVLSKNNEAYNNQLRYLNEQLVDAKGNYATDNEATHQAAAAHDALEKKIEAEEHAGSANAETINKQKATLQDLTNTYNDVKKQRDDDLKKIAEITTAIKTETSARDANLKKISEQKNAQAALSLEWDKFIKGNAEKYKEDTETFKLTTAEKVAYYAKRIADLGALTKDNIEEAKRLYNEELANFKKAQDEKVATYKKAHDDMTNRVSTFLDDVVVKHKSMKDILTSIYDELLQSFIKMVAKMIVESTLFKNIFGNLIPGFGGSSGSSGGGGGLLGLFGLGGSSSGTSSNPVVTTLAPDAIKALTGSSSGVSAFGSGGGASGGGGGLFGLGGGGNSGSFFGSSSAQLLSGLGIGVGGVMAGRQMGGIGGGLLGALGAGMGLNVALGGSMALGGTGGLMSTLALNPLLFGGVMLAAGLFSSGIIGPHYGPDSYSPDRHDATYKPFMDAFNSGPGGIGDKTEKLVASLNAAKLTGQTLADYNQLKGIEAQSGGQLGISNEHNGMFTINNGAQISVTDYRALIDRFNQEATGAATTNAATSVWTLTHLLPNLNDVRMDNWGSYDPATGVANRTAPLPPNDQQQIIVNVNVPPGSVIYASKEQVAQDLADALRIANQTNSGNNRRAF